MPTQTEKSEFAVFTPGKLPPEYACYQDLLEAFARSLSVTLSSGSPGESVKGDRGPRGYSAYEVAIQEGYDGSTGEWLESLNGEDGADARELAVEENHGLIDLAQGAVTHTYQALGGVTPQSIRFWLQGAGNVYISNLGFSGQIVTISFSGGVASGAKLGYYYVTFDYAGQS